MPLPTIPLPIASLLASACCALPLAALATPVCEARSGALRTPVVELYTSEGCSSCPPADQWLSTLKGQPVVAQAFHVAYWDYIGWKDRFAQATFTARQRDIAAHNQQASIYTPQVVRNGRDWRTSQPVTESKAAAQASIRIQRVGATDGFEARVEPLDANAAWTAYWTVTEDGHSSRVKAGENAGEFLKHDFVVRQYTPLGRYQGAQSLQFFALAADAAHPRRINLVVTDPQSGEPLQALSLSCS
ncbi:DUF1223 domain-containing protein [Rhodoferax lacus]|uniref:DUF1223 domain-containing protein n=1 Tax=Rhodoferax lacus TaxID=2184758 RepID=A0A3E1RFH1_9BURK|nr:DUF1223 domain-containing protein [Rhodoferax lacus]RFO98136.1 DUF1223 domain-containing protein [Rhodoferax lacus]